MRGIIRDMKNSVELNNFGWFRPVHGFKLVSSGPGGGGRLAPKQWSDRGTLAQRYRPGPGLFREFARIRIRDKEGILDFADKYGDILSLPGAWEGAERGKRTRTSATLDTWRNQIRHMRMAVKWWDRLRIDPKTNQVQLQYELKAALTDTETPRCSFAYPFENGIRLAPANLLAFMWLSLARVVSGDIGEQPCTGLDEDKQPCPNFVYFEPGLRRYDDRATCSSACRKRKQRPKS
jgi:hypothetical protein